MRLVNAHARLAHRLEVIINLVLLQCGGGTKTRARTIRQQPTLGGLGWYVMLDCSGLI